MMPTNRIFLYAIIPLLGSGCILHHSPAPIPIDRAMRFEPIWEAVLRSYHAEGAPDAVDRAARRLVGADGDTLPPRLGLFLEEHRDSGLGGYRADWMHALAERGEIDGICGPDPHHLCGGAALTSFVRLGDPTIMGDSATVSASDWTEVPAECRRPDHGGFAGFHERTVTLVFRDSVWRVVGARYEMTGSGMCGDLPPAQRAALREDSLFRRRSSPIAGTWRYVVTLAEGDSLVVFARTSRHPSSVLRDRSMADIHASEGRLGRPVVGYYLDANCSFDLGHVDQSLHASMQCSHAVSIDPVIRTRDSIVWRGESEAQLAAWILLDSIPLKPRLRAALGDDEDFDPDWFFMPGYWIRGRNGSFRFRQDVVHQGRLLLRIRGERMSKAVLPEE